MDGASVRLETERLLLRPWEDRDRAPLAAILGDPQVRRFYPRVLTREQSDAAMDRAIAATTAGSLSFFAAEHKATGRLVGWLGIAPIPDDLRVAMRGNPEIEIGWLLAQEFWGQGLAPEAAAAWLHHGFTVLNLPEIVAFTFRGNQPSRRVMEKLGMSRDPAGDFDHPLIAAGHP
ncbi:MAG: N-acetyltransferase, partial [Hyphomicrobiales bacterium]